MKPGVDIPRITFWGAAESVSGSMHLVEAEGSLILLDCGMLQGRHEEARLRNRSFPFHPRQIDAVVLSHAHVDHCGNLPSLVRQGFVGGIYCTPPTMDLLPIMLGDSARIQEEEAAHENIRRNYREPWATPLYTSADADRTAEHAVAVPYHEPREIAPGVMMTLVEAGHVLGSAMVHLRFASGGSLTFTGDLGRRGMPLLAPPAPIPPAELVVCECTYGDRVHEPIERAVDELCMIVRRTLARGGKVLVPAFSLGRAQLVTERLCHAMHLGTAPRVPIYVDSPLAREIVEVYRRHPGALLPGYRPEFLGGGQVHYTSTWEESLAMSRKTDPCVIVASSGMCEAGRVTTHLKHFLDDPRCSIALVSYQAPGTMGHRLLERGPTVRFLGREWNKWADIEHLNGFSAHADRDDLMAYFTPLVGRIGSLALVHGEPESAEGLSHYLTSLGLTDMRIPHQGEQVSLLNSHQ